MCDSPGVAANSDRGVSEVDALREEVKVLSQRVDRLFELLEERRSLPAASSEWSGTFVESVPTVAYAVAPPEALTERSFGLSLPVGPGDSRAALGPVSSVQRETILRDIGVWLRRNLEGDHRGNSGRFRLPESSRFYVILRDHSGRVYTSPVKVVDNFSQAKHLCCKSGSWGNSVFVGLPSLQDMRICLEGGNFSCPPFILDGRD